MSRERILVIEDEAEIQELVRYNLVREGFEVICEGTGEAGLDAVREQPPDLIVLDLMLPGVEGLEVCRLLKRDPRRRHIPILILTARGEEDDIVAGFEAGADDYVTKPFSPPVLTARVKAVLRRRPAGSDESAPRPLRFQSLTIDPGRHEVTVDDEKVSLTSTEFNILRFLASRPGWVFTRKQIVRAAHGESYPVTGRSVDVQIAALRRKLGPAGAYIVTIRGVGYKLGD
jgi:two-component system, OmpR family, alkaline phosphatase synthesis response regulator PhoP